MNTLLLQIENARQELIELACCLGFTDNRVLDKSCELDQLLNRYEQDKGIQE